MRQNKIINKTLVEENFQTFTNQMINKITQNLDSFHYNVIIANFHETYNFLSKLNINEISNSILLENYVKLLIVMSPVIPHFTAECIDEVQKKEGSDWPTINKKFLEKTTLKIVIQNPTQILPNNFYSYEIFDSIKLY